MFRSILKASACAVAALALLGCASTNSVPYQAPYHGEVTPELYRY
jgi:hypothetical protein